MRVNRNQNVLVITSSIDKTVDYLVDKYPNVYFFRFNVDRFSEYTASVTSDGFYFGNQDHTISTSCCHSIYFRKPAFEDVSNVFDQKYQAYARKEIYSFVEGVAEGFKGTCLSRPSVLRRANNKILQAQLAKTIGFKIPQLDITNSLDHAEMDDCQLVVKPIASGTIYHGSMKEVVQTNLVDHAIDKKNLKYVPSYFQKYIKKDFEVRITYIGEESFAVKIDSENRVDWRKLGNKVEYSPMAVPQEINKLCLLFMKHCGIDFGCFDFVVEDGNWFFLEMNANGQWAWLEFETGLNISKSVVDYLTDGSC